MERVWQTIGGPAGDRVWVVGGAVRDWLLGLPVRDVDLAVEGDSERFGRMLASQVGGHYFVMHPASLTARIALRDGWVDLVPLPDGLHHDLHRRDFTVNAMAAPATTLAEVRRQPAPAVRPAWLEDPLNGWRDVRDRILRAASPSALSDDPVRLLRALRLSAHLGFRIEAATEASVRAHAPLLASAAPERARDEWLQTLSCPAPAASIRRAQHLGLLDVVFLEWRPMEGVEQNDYHHLDVWSHTLEVLRHADEIARGEGEAPVPVESAEPLRRYLEEPVTAPHPRRAVLHQAILLHDAGKPQTRSLDEGDGRVHFFGHERVSADLAGGWAARWKLSGRERSLLTDIVALHMRSGALSGGGVTARAIRRFFRDAGHAVPALLLLNVADRLAARGTGADEEEMRRHVEGSWSLLHAWLETRDAETLPLPVSGRDLMAALGLAPGPGVGRILSELQETHAETPFPDRESALAAARALRSLAE